MAAARQCEKNWHDLAVMSIEEINCSLSSPVFVSVSMDMDFVNSLI